MGGADFIVDGPVACRPAALWWSFFPSRKLTLLTIRWLCRWSVSMWVATSTSKLGNSRWASSKAMAWASWGVRSSVSAKDWTKW